MVGVLEKRNMFTARRPVSRSGDCQWWWSGPGAFNATFYGDNGSVIDHGRVTDVDGTCRMINRSAPGSVVGEFDANFSNGSVAGGFGARK